MQQAASRHPGTALGRCDHIALPAGQPTRSATGATDGVLLHMLHSSVALSTRQLATTLRLLTAPGYTYTYPAVCCEYTDPLSSIVDR